MSPRTPHQNKEIRKERREQILETALRLFAEGGYAATSISKIASEAGVAKGLIYNYFPSKEALLEQIIHLAMEKMAGVFTILHQQDKPEATIKELLYYLRDALKQEFLFLKFYSMLGPQLYDKQELLETFADQMQDWYSSMHALMAALGYQNPELETLKFSATTDGITRNYILMKEAYPLDAMIDYLVDSYQKNLPS
ncbi:TetR/AcrR family transcriptional regulator [Cesiribacter andamanensis]|uniref:Fatty acid metabolism regulator protein n=1 Tax=Cesiribacter andamanensis AMV16 TaxID=1279009 RepID=M7NU13_9BACT|nr:TetR/AcrR family transcriptional regulator [Cesiribacter andamanensis]EMR01979.1 Fatty acid metabolism regulator protein [Cesiribacter andamanensis AMV16]